MDKLRRSLTLNDALGAIPAQHRRLFDLVEGLDRVALDSPAGVACVALIKQANKLDRMLHHVDDWFLWDLISDEVNNIINQ